MQKFVLIGAPRTGSTLLVQLLNSSPSVKCHYELFNAHELRIDGVDRSAEMEERNANPMAFLDKIAAESNADVFGFKIFDGHNEELMQELIRRDDWKKLVLNRRNFLSVYSSRLISQKKAVWSQTLEAGKSASVAETSAKPTWNETVEFKEKEFWNLYNRHVSYFQRAVDSLNAAGQHFEYLEYGDLLNEGLVRRVFAYLGAAQPEALTTNMLRNNTSHIISRFENKDTVREFLKGINRSDWVSESDSGWALSSQ